MITISVWLLIITSPYHDSGQQPEFQQFSDKASCEVVSQIVTTKNTSLDGTCVKVNIPVPLVEKK